MGAVKSVTRLFKPSKGAPQQPPRPKAVKEAAAMATPASTEPTADLLNRLKEVYVDSSTDVVTQENPFASDRHQQQQQQQQAREKLPQDRSYSFEDPLSPSHSADGYLTVQGVMEVFQRRAREGDGWSSNDVATDFKISHTDTENLLKYFSAYRVRDSQQKLEKPLQFHLLHE